MTQPNSTGDDRNSEKKPRLYGTQFSSFGSDQDSTTPSAHETGQNPGDTHEAPSEKRAAFGTHFARPIDQQSPPAVFGRPVPPGNDRFGTVRQTRKAGPVDLQRIAGAVNPGKSEKEIASRIRSITESEKTRMLKQRSGDIEQPVGKSTWDLRIHRREVQGQISGIVNPIPASSEALTGLQSALAVNDDAPEYEVLGKLGAGNMGIVYHARQLSLNRELAIKTLKPTSTQAQHDQAMFVSEAVVTANLVHPNIIPIHDLGRTDEGKLFYSMKKVSGVAWNEVIRERSLEDNLDIFMKLCDAVAFAHSRGVINRDLKPENVVVGSFGEVVVLDWGLAITTERFEKRRSVLIEFRGGAGTPVYMAPELLDDDPGRIGPASDIYLLGAILFEILEGFPPHLLRRIWGLTDPSSQFDAVYQAVMYNEIEEDVTHAGELMQIARKAMSTEPADRYISVEALQNAIREYRITGRAEELMNSIDSMQASDYTIYQSAVALYSEALLKWPDNKRAINGDRNARLAYAKLAQKKGDIDLGLQVVAMHPDPVFAPVAAKLRKTRLIRTIIRGTWGVTTVSAVSLLMYCWVLWMQAVQAKDDAVQAKEDLIAKNGELAVVQAKIEDANTKVREAKDAAEVARSAADKAISDAESAKDVASKAEDAARQAKEDKANAQKEAADANEEAIAAKTKADKSIVEAENAKEAARTASMDAQKAKMEAAAALKEKEKYEYDGFIQLIQAEQKLFHFDEVVQLAEKALTRIESNKIIKENETVLRKQVQDAKANGGNSKIPLPNEPNSASISSDGNTVVVYFGGLQKSVLIYRSVVSDANKGRTPQTIPVTINGEVKLAVSDDGEYFCLATASEKQFWRLQNDQYVRLNSEKRSSTAKAGWQLKKVFFASGRRHFYAIGGDEDATVEIYSADTEELLLRQRLTGGDTIDFRIRDAVLLPDESALIVQFENQKCFQFGLTWSDSGKPKFDQARLSRNAPAMDRVKVPDHPEVVDTPERLFISPDGKRLALVYRDTVVFLPRNPGATKDLFSFSVPDQSPDYQILKATYPVEDVQFSALRGVPRVATGHRQEFIELWDLSGKKYEPCSAEALYEHHLTSGVTANCLRGHSKEVKAFAFAGDDGDRMISVSADKSIRTWEISTYAELAKQIMKLRETFEQVHVPDSVQLPAANPKLPVIAVDRSKRDAALRLDRSYYKTQSEYLPTAGPLSQPPESSEPKNTSQGQAVYSARFSPDGSRFLIGADDLAAHAYNSQTGEEILTASMIGRKDLLFDPARNVFLEGHVSEISAIRFVPPKGELLLSADYFGSISAWDAVPDENGVGFERSRLLSEYSFSEFAVSDDGSLILAGGATTDNPSVRLDEAKLRHKGVLWKTEDLRSSPTPVAYGEFKDQHPQFAITAVAISPSNEHIVTAGRRGKIVVWNVATGSVVAEVDGQHHRDQVSGIFFEDETTLVTCGYDGRVIRSRVSENELVAKPIERSDGQFDPAFIIRMRPSPDRQRFVTSDVTLLKDTSGSRKGHLNITIWSADGTTRVLLSKPIQIPENDKSQAFRHDVSWSSDGSKLMLIHDGDVGIFDTTDWKLIHKFTCDQRGARPLRGVFAPSIAGQPERIATFDGRVTQMWELPNNDTHGVQIAEFRSHARYSVTASYSSNGNYVATASETLRIFDAAENSSNHGETLFRLPVGNPHRSPLADAAFTPAANDLRLATIDHDGTMAMWQWTPAAPGPLMQKWVASRAQVENADWMIGLTFGNATAWSPDGKFVAALQGGVISLWNSEENVPERIELPLPEGIQCRFNQLQFSKKAAVFAAGGISWDESTGVTSSFAAVWDIRDQMPRLIAKIDTSDLMHTVESKSQQRTGITAIAIDDQNNEIVTGGVDGRLIRWQMIQRTDASVPSLVRIRDVLIEKGTKNPHSSMITALDLTSAGQLLTADEKGNVFLWPMPAK